MGRSHVQKFQRAEEHLESLGERVQQWRKSAENTVFGEADPEDPRFQIFYIENVPVAPEQFSPTIGDVVQNLRACLDHLAHELATGFTGQLSPTQEANVVFPIYRSEAEFRDGTTKLRRLLGSDASAAIQRLQPYYNRPDRDPEWDLLWQLQELAARDQRRGLDVVRTIVGRYTVESIMPVVDFDPTGTWFRTGPPPTRGRAPIARLPLLPAGTEDAVMGKVTASLDIALAEPPCPPAADPIHEVLVDIAAYLQSRVFKVLEPLLPPSRPSKKAT